jgi:hypothetical protein
MGFDVDPDTLRTASGQISRAVSGASEIQLESVTGSGESYGHPGVFEALSGFCSTWQLATQLLHQRATSAGQALTGAAAAYTTRDHRSHTALPGADR